MKINRSKGGFTIFEVVMAMAVIIAVSVAAIVCINSFSKISSSMVSRNEAVSIAENALEGFKFANSLSEFDSLTGTFSNKLISRESYEESNNESTHIARATYVFENVYYALNIRVIYNYTAKTAVCSISVLDARGIFIYNVNGYTKAVIDYD